MKGRSGPEIYLFLVFFTFTLLQSCQPRLPEKLNAFSIVHTSEQQEDSLYLHFRNPLACPIQLNMTSDDTLLGPQLAHFNPFVLNAGDSVRHRVYHPENDAAKKPSVQTSVRLGNNEGALTKPVMALPFPKGKSYRMIQGYNGSFSHNGDYSRYAIDFDLQEGDTITAAYEGIVVSLIEAYQHSGTDRNWRDFANYLTLYHPELNVFTQYVHFQKDGSLVEMHDTVSRYQPIALSGMTGWTTTPHLHFNVLQVGENGLTSMKILFENDINPENLSLGDTTSHQ